MAYSLKAVLSLDGNSFSDGMKKAERITRTTQKAMDSLAKSTNHTRDANGRLRDSMGRFVGSSNKMAGSIGKLKLGLGGLVGALGGVAAGYAAVESAKSIFQKTVGEDLKYEQSAMIIEAMFGDPKKAESYMKRMNKLAIDSPLLNSQDIMGSSKSFIQFTQDIPKLERMFKLSERLVATSPEEGIEGAVYAMKELLTGSAVSIRDRFEFGTSKEWKEITKLDGDLDGQLDALDELMSKYRLTDALIKRMGDSTLGVWSRVKETASVMLREMGEPSRKVVGTFLQKLLTKLQNGDFSSAANIGANIIKGTLTGLTNGAMSLMDWFTTLTSSEEFKSKTSLSSKISFVIEDVFQRFSGWMETTGKEQLTKATKFMMEVAASGLMAAQTPLVEAATNIGIAVGKALGSAASKEIKASVDNYLSGIELPGLAPVKIGGYIGKGFSDFVSGDSKSKSTKKSGKSKSTSSSSSTKTPSVVRIQPKIPVRGSFNAGTDRIHSDGLYRLHKDEAVLNRGKADKYRNGGGIGGHTYKFGDIHLHGVSGDMQKDADQLVGIIVKKLMAAGEAGA